MMERDFLGIGGRDAAVRDEAGNLGSSAVQWPFSIVAPAKQQFMNFQAAQEERSKNIMFDQFSSGFQPMSAADAFTSAHRTPTMISQKHLGMDGQGIHQFQIPGYPARGSNPFSASAANHPSEVITFPAASHNSFPIGASSPLFKAGCSATGLTTAVTTLKQQHPLGGGSAMASPGVGSLTAFFAPRDMIKPPVGTAQLTIFYGGAVHVYDDVSLEKAQAIMFLAGNPSSVNNSTVGNVAVQAPVTATAKGVSGVETKNMNQNQAQRNATPACSALSSPISTSASHSGAQSGSGSNATVDLTGAKTTISLAPTGQLEPPKSVVTTAVGSACSATLAPRAVPQARKASLARFLEKRKERVTSVAPYPSAQKTPDCTSGADGKAATGEAAHSSSLEQSWCLGAQKNSSDSSNSLSTKLEM